MSFDSAVAWWSGVTVMFLLGIYAMAMGSVIPLVVGFIGAIAMPTLPRLYGRWRVQAGRR